MSPFLLNLLAACKNEDVIPDQEKSLPEDSSITVDSSEDSGVCVPDICDGRLDPNAKPSGLVTCYSLTEATEGAALKSDDLHAGTTIIDYDTDGRDDVFVMNYGTPNQLFRNLGGGVFQDVSATAGLDFGGDSRSAIAVDYDGDGDSDLAITTFSGTYVCQNDSGIFSSCTTLSDSESAGAIAWLGVGFFVAGDGHTSYYSYEGHRFSDENGWDQALAVGLDDQGIGSAIAVGDYNNDGCEDVYLANIANSRNRLFQNQCGGTYLSVEDKVGIATDDNSATSAQWVVLPGDDLPSMVVTNYGKATQLYRNLEDGTFEDQSIEFGLTDDGQSTGAAWSMDFSSVPVALITRYDQENLLEFPILSADGALKNFENIAEPLQVNNTTKSLAARWFDADGDALQDLILVTYDAGLKFYHNNTHEVNLCDE